jgi:hypothetical protein
MLVDVPVPMMPPGFNLTVAANLADDQNFVPLLTLFTASHMARPELNPHRSAHTDAVWRRTYCADINPLLTTDLSVELSRGPNRRTSPAVPGATCRNRATRPEARDARCQRHDRWRLEDGARARGGRVYPAAQPGVFRGSNVERKSVSRGLAPSAFLLGSAAIVDGRAQRGGCPVPGVA